MKTVLLQCRALAIFLLPALIAGGAYSRANAQSQLDSSGIPQATSSFPVEHGVVNLNNGVLHLEIPIVNYSQRGNVQLPATLNYDSNIWKINSPQGGTSFWSPNALAPSGQTTAGGWYVSYHPANMSITPVQWGFIPCADHKDAAASIYSGISWTDQSGSAHVFPATIVTSTCTGTDGNSYTANTTASAYATDGSGYYASVYDANPAYYETVNIYDRSGTLVASNSLNATSQTLTPGQFSNFGGIGLSEGPILPVDRNGNSPAYSSTTSSILDTMGRNLVQDTGITNVAGVGTVEYINVPVAGGNTATYTINYKTITAASSFNYSGTDDLSLTMMVVSSVVLPDGSSYQFGYNENSFGEVNSMTLPHGGQVSFMYETAAGVSGGIPTRWVKQHVGSDGTTNFSWTQASTSSYSQAGSTCGAVTNQVTTLSAQNTYKFSNCGGNIQLREVDHGSATSTAIDAIDLYSYDTTHPCPTLGTAKIYPIACTGLQWMNITGKTTVLPPHGGASTSLVRDTQYTYDHPGSGVPSSVKQWDYYAGAPTSLPDSPPGLPTKEVDTNLDYGVNGALFPTEIAIRDSTGTIVSSTTYKYDEDGYMSTAPSTIPGHNNNLVSGNRGNLTTVIQCCGWNGSSSVSVTGHTWYDDAGSVHTTQDANGYQTSITAYDPTDTFPITVQLPNTTSATGAVTSHTRSMTYDSNSGQLASVTDENGQTTTYTFDQYGRPFQVKFSNDGSPVVLQTTTYPSATETDVSVLQSPGVYLTTSSFVDAFGRPISSVTGGVSSETHYDAQGRVDMVTNTHAGTQSSTDGYTTYTHDELGRIVRVNASGGNAAFYSYVQNQVTVTDALGNSRLMVSDAFGNTTSVYEPDSSGALNYVTNYQYNWQNKLTQVLQKGGTTDSSQWRKRTFAYDSLGRLISQMTPEAKTVQFGYDNNGNLTTTQNANPTKGKTTYAYDELNRVKSVTVGDPMVDSAADIYTYTYTYDAQDGSGDLFGKGLLTSTSNGSSIQTLWQHDALGRTVSSVYCMPSNCAPGYTVQASFDFQGNQTSLTYPDGRQVQWTYNQLNQPVSETYAKWGSTAVNAPYLSNLSYTPGGQLQQATFGNSAIQFGATYNSAANLSSLVYTANGTPIVEKTYTWDANASNLTKITDLAAGRTQMYQYDNLNRLFGFSDTGKTADACNANLPALPAASQSFTTDQWGNMKSSGTDAFSQMIGADNRLYGYDYDGAGNLKGDGSHVFQYRADGLMTNSDANTYTYDALGQRVRKDGTSSKEYIYYGGQVLSMLNPGTTSWTDRIYGPMGAFATVPGSQAGAPVYRATDHLGSLSYTLDTAGNIIESSTALPYGQVPVTTNDNFVFTDHERDEDNTDATLYRHYASSQGRWLSPDPSNGSYNLLDPQSLNRYAYLSNRPVAKVDRLGLDGDDDDDYSGGLSYGGGDDDDGGGGDGSWWDSFGDDLESFFSFGFFGGGGGGGSTGPHGGVPGVSQTQGGVPGTTQLNSGASYLATMSYNSGSIGVDNGASSSVDATPGLDRDGMTSIPMNYQGLQFNIPCGAGLGCGSVSTPSAAPNSSGCWYDPTSHAIGEAGIGAAAVQYGAGARTIGSNLKLYASGWRGNQYVRTLKLSKVADFAGRSLAVAGIAVDAYAYMNGTISGEKFALNTAVAAIGVWGGPYGAAAAVVYFGVDYLYPNAIQDGLNHLGSQPGSGCVTSH